MLLSVNALPPRRCTVTGEHDWCSKVDLMRVIQMPNFAPRVGHSLLLAALMMLPVAAPIAAQSVTEVSVYRTRRQLDSIATDLERAGKNAEAGVIRNRMRVGDFYPGDKIFVELYGDQEPFRDTLSVRAGQEVILSAYPAFSLKGVLRSEADSALNAQAKRFLQRPTVRTQSLVRLQVTGAVGRPGFYTVRGDAAVTDVVSSAGGLTSQARLSKSKIKRASEIIVDRDSLGTIFRSGMTLDQADLRAGDELAIDEKRQSNIQGLVFTISTVMGLAITVVSLLNR
jgi:hypothetical protein